MNKIIAFILMTLLSVFVISDCYAQDQELMTVAGKVTKVDASRSTITVKLANESTFSVPSSTPIICDAKDIRLSDVETGQYVTVEHYKDPSGNLIATNITVENFGEQY